MSRRSSSGDAQGDNLRHPHQPVGGVVAHRIPKHTRVSASAECRWSRLACGVTTTPGLDAGGFRTPVPLRRNRLQVRRPDPRGPRRDRTTRDLGADPPRARRDDRRTTGPEVPDRRAPVRGRRRCRPRRRRRCGRRHQHRSLGASRDRGHRRRGHPPGPQARAIESTRRPTPPWPRA